MAACGTFSCLVFLIFSLTVCYSQILPDFTDYVQIESCADGTSPDQPRYFNAVTLKCGNCRANSTVQRRSANGLTCECQPGYRYAKNFGGKEVTCVACGANQAVSDDGWECVECPGVTSAATGTCDKCLGDREVNVLRLLDGNFATATASGVGQVTCQTCSADTQPNDGLDRCDRCSTTLSIRSAGGCDCDSATEEQLKDICFQKSSLPADYNAPSLSQITLENSQSVSSAYLTENVIAEFILCKDYNNSMSCQSLANMCVLTMYQGSFSPARLAQACYLLTVEIPNSLIYFDIKPQIFIQDDAEDVLYSKEIRTQWTVDPPTTFPFLVGQFSLDGVFEGFQEMTGGFLQLCDASENFLNAAFVFGTYYSHSCSIPALSLWDPVKYPLKFYEIYLRYTSDGRETLYRVPVKILNYRNFRGNRVNEGSDIGEWKLMRRFFLVDNVATQSPTDSETPYVRYASEIQLRVELQGSEGSGQIYVPSFDILYADVSLEDARAGAAAPLKFSVSYTMTQEDYTRSFQIATGTLSCFAVIFAGYRTYVWNKRAGRLTIDFPTLVNFIFNLCNYLGNAFFAIVFGIAFYFFIFFKRQNVVFLVHLDGQGYEEWLALFGAAFTLKALSLMYMIIMQCWTDIFLVDWERPKGQQVQPAGDHQGQAGATGKGKKYANTVSIWRTYFVANEWNEIQSKRKINRVFQIFAVVFFLHVVGFEDTTTKDPDGSVGKSGDTYMSEQSEVFRMALATLVYLLVDIVQVIFFLFIYERFISDDIREFVDLCSMSNVSVFIMAHGEFGYYIHGRSVHGRADVSMREMSEMLEREVNDLVGKRGLVPQTEAQTFIMALPKRLRQRYDTVYMPVQLEGATAASRAEQGKVGSKEKSIEAYGTLNRFLCAFIDHSLREVDYVVKEKSFVEKILDTEFLELTDKGIFYSDNGHSFDNILFYGNELTLVVFDTLFFCIVDLIFQDFVLAGVITFLATELICQAREMGGKKNLAKKTLVDERFLI
ncbi:meckelin [Aplysia californica]|uniref:Meckelin n=1 Tax=Aplysia californica TaxID=6500 RepID=A0ABM1A9S4_APLCA|nr:meckelin [Aplysia californica]